MPSEVRSVTYGPPVAQGSMVAVRSRNPNEERTFLKASNEKALRPWRKAVARDALKAMGDELPWKGPVRLFLTFTLARPMIATEREYPTTPPDLDKLERAVLDALTGVLLEDDKLVVDLQGRKRYVGHPEALPQPGVRITAIRL